MDYSSPMESVIVLVDSALICKCFVLKKPRKQLHLTIRPQTKQNGKIPTQTKTVDENFNNKRSSSEQLQT